jgi:hypothetical protein
MVQQQLSFQDSIMQSGCNPLAQSFQTFIPGLFIYPDEAFAMPLIEFKMVCIMIQEAHEVLVPAVKGDSHLPLLLDIFHNGLERVNYIR